MDVEQPIIIIKKKGGHGGHHGGAWKVAYADFVTAMMSLFIVLWLMNSTPKETQEQIAGYFNDPKGTATKKGSEGKPVPKETKEKKDDMASLKVDLTKIIQNTALLDKIKKQIEITVTEEGLRVELVEGQKGTFFEVGSPRPTPMLEDLLKVLAGQMKNLPNHLLIEGYTDAQPYVQGNTYSNWELSTDRANVARREMQSNGIRLDQVSQVRGYGDQNLHIPDKPFDAGNRRVSLVVQNLVPPTKAKTAASEPTKQPTATAPPEKPSSPNQPAQATAITPVPATAEAKPPEGMMARAKGIFSRKH